MYIPESAETVRAVLEAEDIAARAQQRPCTAHLLLAFFTFPNRAQILLNERNVDEDIILREIRGVEDEPAQSIQKVRQRAREIASGAAATEVDSLHLLIAMTRLRSSFAYTLLESSGTSVTALRNVAVSYITGNMPRRFRQVPKPKTGKVLDRRPRPNVRTMVQTSPNTAAEPERAPIAEKHDLPEPLLEPFPASPEGKESNPPLTQEAEPPQPKKVPAIAPEAENWQEFAPTLYACGVELTEMARQGQLDAAVGREQELERLIDVLGKRRSNNPVLVGPPGVGKTAIVEGLAVKMVRGDADVSHFHDRILFALDTGALIAGTSLRGAFAERMAAIKSEVAAASGRIIVFIDELHTLIGAGTSGDSAQDAANELKTALARGEFPCIGATTTDEFRKYIERDPALERRFDPIDVEEPSVDEAILILESAIAPYSEHHGVTYSLEAVHAAVQLAHRFVPERKLPDKAFALADLAGSRARRRGDDQVTRLDIARLVNEWSGVPLERLADADSERFQQAASLIEERLIGHKHVIQSVCSGLKRGLAGFNNPRPMGSFLFLGPTGVGKTELVKILAEFLFGHRDAIVRFDMSELSEKHSVSRLIGAQPGYVGYEEGGQLTEALRKKPFQIVLFDEIEKAHADVLNILLQILDEGHLTDGRGRKVMFTNTMVILTSNLGAEAMNARQRGIGFSGAQDEGQAQQVASDKAMAAAQEFLPPELWGRLDDRLVFAPLNRHDVSRIAELQLHESNRNLFAEREITLEWQPEVIEFLLEHGGFSQTVGARGMRQAIQRHVEGPIAEQIIAGELHSGDLAIISCAAHQKTLHIARR